MPETQTKTRSIIWITYYVTSPLLSGKEMNNKKKSALIIQHNATKLNTETSDGFLKKNNPFYNNRNITKSNIYISTY